MNATKLELLHGHENNEPRAYQDALLPNRERGKGL